MSVPADVRLPRGRGLSPEIGMVLSQLLRISILGGSNGGEEWSVNPVFRLSGVGDIISSGEGAAIVSAINALTVPTTIRVLMAASTTIIGARVEARNLDGSLQGVFEGLRGAALAGTGAAAHPPQCAVVASLRTQVPGPSGRGRMYWPATGAALNGTSLRLDATALTNALAGFKSYLQAIETAIETALGIPASLDVWSRKNGTSAAVDRIQLGDVIDTQRRRRDTLPETYSETVYP